MKKLMVLAMLFIITSNIFAQIDTTLKEFFPLQVGNLWQYWNNADNQLHTMTIAGDTTLDGYLYFVVEGSGGLRTNSIYMRIDSLMRVELYGGNVAGGPCIIYKLAEEDSSVWEACYDFSGLLTLQPLIRYNGIIIQNVFGQPREVMHFDFGGPLADMPKDTVFGFGARVARGIGIIEEHYFDFGGAVVLQGAIIDGIQYGTIVSIDDAPKNIPGKIALYQNYPNPFNPVTTIRYDIPVNTHASLKVFNLLGQEVAVLTDRRHLPGSYEVIFDASHLSSGFYVYVLQTAEVKRSGRMLLIK